MKKKQIIGLGTLLLVLLLGLFTTCYANSYREFTNADVKNFLYKSYISAGHTDVEVDQAIQNHEDLGHIEDIVTALNSYKYCFITRESGSVSGNFVHVYCYNSTNVHPYKYGSSIPFKNVPSGLSCNIYYNGTYATGSYIYGVGESDFNIIFIGDNIYAGSNNNTITYSAGYYRPTNLFDGPYQDSSPIYFDMQEYAAQQYVDVEFVGDDKLTYNYSDIPLYSLPTKTSEVYFGNLYNEELATLKEDRFAVIYWFNNKWVAKTLDSRILNNYATSSPYLNISTNDLIEYTYSQIGRYVVKDCFYFYSIDDSDGNRAVALWYVESSNTVISGDKIDPSTFDNNDNYNNEVQNLIDKIDNIDNIIAGTEPIIDTITNDEDVSGDLAAFISGDADDLAAKFGYNPIENPFTTVVLDIVQQLTDVLLGSGNATIDLSNHGLNWVINSRDIYLPPGRITTFIHLMCNAWFIWGIYKYGFQLYQWIQSGRLQNLVNETNRHQYFLF